MELLGMTEVEKPALTVLLHRFLLPEDSCPGPGWAASLCRPSRTWTNGWPDA